MSFKIISPIKKMFSAVLVAIIIMALPLTVYAAELPTVEREKIRVGFFELEGYHQINSGGIKSGYGYDFIQMISRYNNWSVEYPGYESSWADAQKMLQNGEIDILTSARKTAEREKLFDYSDQPIGYSYTLLTVRAGDTRYVIGDRDSYKGMRVGMLGNNTRNDSFAAFAEKNNITYQSVMYENNNDMVSDLKSGKNIDAIVTSSLRKIEGETVLEEFDSSPFYAIVKKGNTKLLDQINNAISLLDIRNSDWRSELKAKYYTPDTAANISFSATELAYLNKLKENNVVLRVIANPDMAPYSYYENGEMKGIAPRVFAKIAEMVGISYEVIPSKTNSEYMNQVHSGTFDLDLTCVFDYSLAEKHDVGLTEAYLSTVMATVVRDTYSGNLHNIGIVAEADQTVPFADKLFSNVTQEEYSTRSECTKAVISGKVDGAFMYSYSAQKMVTEDTRNRLKYILMPDYTVEFAIGVTSKADFALLAIINKGVKSVKLTYVDKIVQEELNGITRADSIIAWLYDHPGMAVGVIGLVIIAIFVMLLSISRIKHNTHIKRQAAELERFKGYVCRSNDMVLEVNLDTMQSVRHYYQNGKLLSKTEPYFFANYQNPDGKIDSADFTEITTYLTREKMMSAIAEGGKGFYFEAKVLDTDGIKKWFSYTLQVISRDKLHPNNFIIFKKNIDETKRKEEEQKQALEDALATARSASMAKGQFLSRMSHEIRTPLNAVIGYMDIAKGSGDNPQKVMHCVENSSIAARHLLNIINDVLDISSIESGKMKIANSEFDLKKQITTVSTIFFNQSKEKSITFEVVLNDLTEEWVIGDSLRLNQILMNLLSNAVKFTQEKGKITLTVSQMRLTDTQVFIKFEISDTGIGMSEEYKKRIFTPFEQESAVTAQKYGGTGLGLSITKNLVSMMNGSIDVKSHQNEGTTFVVSICFARSQKDHSASIATFDYSHVRVLVVDDEKSSCDYIKAMLKRCGVKSDTVTSGEDAIRQIKRRKGSDYEYNMCIIDWSMPGMDGVETTKCIRDEYGPNLPIIIATAYDITEFEEEALKSGVTKIVSKPLFQSTMFDLLVTSCGKYIPSSTENSENYSLKGLKVLLAEDNEMNREIALTVLTNADVEVVEVTDGKQAVDAVLSAKPGTYDAVLMDIQMPILNGYQATQKIRESEHPDVKKLPIIAMTANAFNEDVAEALASGMNDHISKPIDYDKLFTVLGKILSEQSRKDSSTND